MKTKSKTSKSSKNVPSQEEPVNVKEQQTLGTAVEEDHDTKDSHIEETPEIVHFNIPETSASPPVTNSASNASGSLNDRLFALRMKINQSRKQNRDDVEQEYQRISGKKGKSSSTEDAGEREEESFERKRKPVGSTDDVDSALLQTTVEDAAWQADNKKRKEDIAATYGLSAFSSDASYRAYEKRVQKLTNNSNSSSNANEQAITHANYGQVNGSVSQEALEKLRQDVIERENARKKFSRKRVGEESGDVDYINEKNRQFNKKLRHAFDKYTVEIRQNLERGTAL
jgi:hypothetical protein